MKDVKELKFCTGVYLLKIKHHTYVGSSVNLRRRIKRHLSACLKNIHDNCRLQRAFNKYGENSFSWEVLETFEKIEYKDLLVREKYWIDKLHPDLNAVLDPVTNQQHVSLYKKVYQFNLLGELEKEWSSISEASNYFKVDPSNITVACHRPKRQRIVKGHLWSFSPKYDKQHLKIIYVFDLSGKYIDRFGSTIDIYERFFMDISRKTVLSQLNKKIDSGIPYKNIYLSYSRNFKINKKYKPKYKEPTELMWALQTNPTVYKFDDSGKLIESKKLNEYTNKQYVKRKIQNPHENGKCFYSIDPDFKPKHEHNHYHNTSVVVENVETKERTKFKSIKEAIIACFNPNKKDMVLYYKKIHRRFKNKKPLNGFLFIMG